MTDNKLINISLSSINFKNPHTHKEVFKHLHPLIFVNYYKFLVLQELMPPTSKTDHVNTLNTLIRLTSLSLSSIIPASSSIEVGTLATVDNPYSHALLQRNLTLPFDWKFFQQMVIYFDYAFFVLNVHDNTKICYKSRHLQEKKYVVIKYKSPCDLTLYYKSF